MINGCPFGSGTHFRWDDAIEVLGRHPDGNHVTVRFSHLLLTDIPELTSKRGSPDTQLKVKLPATSRTEKDSHLTDGLRHDLVKAASLAAHRCFN